MIVFFYDNNQIVCILLLWMLLGGIGVPMATVSAQDVSTDSTGRAVKLNQVVISKRDMRMIVLRPTGDTLAVFVSHAGETMVTNSANGTAEPQKDGLS